MNFWVEGVTLQNAATATGNGAPIQLSDLGGVLIAISGTFTATVSFEARGPDGTYYSVLGTKLSDGTTGTSTTGTGLWFFQLPGAGLFRTPVTWTSGTSVTVVASACPAYSPITSAILSTGDLEIGAVEIKDGAADIRQTVLAASTASQATDKASVVALHPTSPLPAGSAIIGKVGVDQTTPGTTNGVSLAQIGATTVSTGTGAQGAGAQRVTVAVDSATVAGSTSLPAGTNSIGGAKDNGPHWTAVHGISSAPFTSADQHSAVASVTDAPTSGQKLVITDILMSVDTAMSVMFKCETTGAIICGPFYLPANGSLQVTPRGRWKLATADKKLQVLTSVAGNVMVDAHYFSEP